MPVQEKKTLPYFHIEAGTSILRGDRVEKELFSLMMSNHVIVCVDAVPVNLERRTIFLAKRIIKPAAGWWWIGGGMFAFERELEAMCRCFKRETGLQIEEKRFKFVELRRYFWKDRCVEPQNKGRDDLVFTFLIELTPEEIIVVGLNLDEGEYDRSFGLREFDRERLISENVCQPVIDFYDFIFGGVDNA